MSTRRFVGFAAQVPSGEWLCQDHNAGAARLGPRAHRGTWPTRADLEADLDDAGEDFVAAARVVKVFAVPRGVVVPPVAQANAILSLEGAPSVRLTPPTAAGSLALFGCLLRRGESLFFRPIVDKDTCDVGTREEVRRSMNASDAIGKGTPHVVRILPEGEHEAALVAARGQGLRDGRWGALQHLRDLLRRCPDTEVEGVKAAIATIEKRAST